MHKLIAQVRRIGEILRRLFILTLMILLVGCANSYELVNQTDNAILYFDPEEVYIPREQVKIVEDDMVYNMHYNSCYIVVYEGKEYRTFEEIELLLSILGPEELFELGYKMDRIPLDGYFWEKNYT